MIGGCPLRIQWGKPRPLGDLNRPPPNLGQMKEGSERAPREQQREQEQQDFTKIVVPKPPGEEDEASYPSQMGS